MKIVTHKQDIIVGRGSCMVM